MRQVESKWQKIFTTAIGKCFSDFFFFFFEEIQHDLVSPIFAVIPIPSLSHVAVLHSGWTAHGWQYEHRAEHQAGGQWLRSVLSSQRC